MSDRVDTVCPCCSTKLVVDTGTGEVLAEERPRKDHDHTFAEAMSSVRSGAGRREEAFSKAFDRTKKLDDLLDKKFEEARKKAAKDPDKKAPSPFDSD